MDTVLVWNGCVDESVRAKQSADSGDEAGRCGDIAAAAPRPNTSLAFGVLEGKDTKGRFPMIRLLSILVVVAALAACVVHAPSHGGASVVLAAVDLDLNQPAMA